ncbi:hypothetical protein FHR83_003382 [Actinoplanes campanulatus]|uniref:Uncharacterized protein n=1 Tax=Actinoplanes campanulatus TaxID=113559 RepID=A0A7W5FEW0_9ACTN|nr:hypothetical protein [Actinoplanes campanulatus]MBB3095712.1 hypothetical protein [Actinoplanes campanulatus]GGN10983.1 hypothetical protein GCM10010109_20910 [Actinoplanes campanulatus]GID36607.1 hypothetical protein Aca09nite_31130 [Actinoplanes campanulatus]
MTDLYWEDVGWYFADEGALLDAYVFDASMADWQLILDVVRSRGWPFDYSSGDTPEPLPDRVEDIFERRGDYSATLHIRPGAGVVVATHFFSPEEIEFDFDPNDLQGQEALVLQQEIRFTGL